MTAKSEPAPQSVNLFSTLATPLHKLDFYLSPAPQNQITNTSCNLNCLKYACSSSQIRIKTPLPQRISSLFKEIFQNWNENYLVKLDTDFSKTKFPLVKMHFENMFDSHYSKKWVLFASNHIRIQSDKSQSKFHSYITEKCDIKFINLNQTKLPSKNLITRVRFIDSSSSANPPSTPSTSSSTANPPPTPITPISPAVSSGVSTTLNTSPQILTFDIVKKYLVNHQLHYSPAKRQSIKRYATVF